MSRWVSCPGGFLVQVGSLSRWDSWPGGFLDQVGFLSMWVSSSGLWLCGRMSLVSASPLSSLGLVTILHLSCYCWIRSSCLAAPMAGRPCGLTCFMSFVKLVLYPPLPYENEADTNPAVSKAGSLLSWCSPCRSCSVSMFPSMSLGLMVAILGWHVAGVNCGMLAVGPHQISYFQISRIQSQIE